MLIFAIERRNCVSPGTACYTHILGHVGVHPDRGIYIYISRARARNVSGPRRWTSVRMENSAAVVRECAPPMAECISGLILGASTTTTGIDRDNAFSPPSLSLSLFRSLMKGSLTSRLMHARWEGAHARIYSWSGLLNYCAGVGDGKGFLARGGDYMHADAFPKP